MPLPSPKKELGPDFVQMVIWGKRQMINKQKKRVCVCVCQKPQARSKQNKKTKTYSYPSPGSSWLPYTPVIQPTNCTQYTGRSRCGSLRAPTPRPASQRRGHDLPPLPLGAAAKGGKGGGCENGWPGKNPKAQRRAVTGNLPAAQLCAEPRLWG